MRRLIVIGCLVGLLVPGHASAQSWTAPRTWTTGELVTAAIMNSAVRDNETVLRAGGIAIASQGANEIVFASSSTQLSRSSLFTWDGTRQVISFTDTAGATTNELLRLQRSTADAVGDANRLAFYGNTTDLHAAIDMVVTVANSSALDFTTRNAGVTGLRGRIHASGGWSVGDTTDPGATNFRVAGTSTLVGVVTLSDSLGLDGQTPSTAGIKFAAATPAVTTAALYSTDGVALFFNGTQLATGSSVSGTAGRVGRFTAATTIGDSIIRDDGSTIAVNAAVATAFLVDIGGSFTAGGATGGALFAIDGAITGAVGQTISGARITNNFTEAASGVHARISVASVEAGTVTAGVALVTDTATLYVQDALVATVTGANWAIWSDAGGNRFDGGITTDATAAGTGNLRVAGTSALVGNVTMSGTGNAVGTVTSGTWNGNTLGAQYGGTGLNSSASNGVPSLNAGTWQVNNVLTANRLLYGAASNTVGSSANLTYDGTNFAVGTAIASAFQARVGGTFTATTGTVGAIVGIDTVITGDPDDPFAGLRVTNNFVEAATGLHALISTARLEAGTVTAGAALVTNTATLYVDNALAATVTGNNYAAWFDAGEVRVDGSFVVGGTTSTTDYATRIASVFTAAGGATGGALFAIDGAITGAVGQTISGARITNNFTEAASGVHARISTASVESGTVTAGIATVTDTATFYVQGALSATVTGGNYAVWVDAGPVRIDGGLNVGGASDPGATNLTVVGTGSFGDRVNFSDGSVTAPAVRFTNDADTGIYFGAIASGVGVADEGIQVAEFYNTATIAGVMTMPERAVGTGNTLGASIVIGRNSSVNGAAGVLGLMQKDGNRSDIWSDDTGVLRTSGATSGAPEEDGAPSDTSGTVVGTQTSTLDTKTVLGPGVSQQQALATLLRTPVLHFRYRGGSYSGTAFDGIAADLSPDFAMDPDETHPFGRSFNPVSAFGYTVQAVKELQRQIDELRSERQR